MQSDVEPNQAEVSGFMSESDAEYDDQEPHHKAEEDDNERMADNSSNNKNNTSKTPSDGAEVDGEPKKKYDSKDPMRPRRKKARRACFACQRAHLTCGDERPCQRCIKRGLADQCQDGVRKKAKYLHDAPPEALGPVLGPGYNNSSVHGHSQTLSTRPNGHRHPSSNGSEASPTVGTFYTAQGNAPQFPVFSPPQPPMAALQQESSFASQHSPVSPTFHGPNNSQMGGMAVSQVSADIPNFTTAFFDPSNPAIFNFDLEGLTFGSQYSAVEFNILNQMSAGAAGTPPRDQSISTQGGGGDGNYNNQAGVFGNGVSPYEKLYDPSLMGEFLGLDHSVNGVYSQGNLQHGLPHAYAIAAGPRSLQSPSTENNSPQATNHGFEGSPTTTTYATGGPNATSQQQHPGHASAARAMSKPSQSVAARILGGHQLTMGKKQRDPSYIYESVKEPYQYVKSFHNLIALLQTRFAPANSAAIAQSLASIRPSFISCTRTLNSQDLVFMEKSFQRALFEYEDFMFNCPSPALICRRTGEVAGVNKEFTALTGWTKEVLLGVEPNNNVNTGISTTGSASGSTGRAGQTTPRVRTLNETSKPPADNGKQPVFLAELMDEDSVREFYKDYAQLAFNNSRGTVTRKCRLLKYRTLEQAAAAEGSATGSMDDSPQKNGPQHPPKQSILSNRVARIDGEHGISKLERDGKLECTYTWSIKRDTFDIPMMIVINFLPCYYRNHNQLAV